MSEVFVRWTVAGVENELLFDSEVGPPPGILPAWPVSIDDTTASFASSAAGQREGKLGYHSMGSGGRCDWTHLAEAVAEATSGSRAHSEPFDPAIYAGHHMVKGLNFNSLDRIVTAFVDAALIASPSAPEERRGKVEVQFEVWQDDMVVATSTDEADARHYLAVYSQDGPTTLMRAETRRAALTPVPGER